MIYAVNKPFHVIFWPGRNQRSEPAEKLEFDKLEAATAVFETARSSGQYGSGTLIGWRKTANEWYLIDRFPEES